MSTRIDRCLIGPPSPCRTGWTQPGSRKEQFFGSCGISGLAAPFSRRPWARSCKGVRLPGPEGDFGGTVCRRGFVTDASRQGVPLPAIMRMTEQPAVSSVVEYFQTAGATANPAVRWLED